MQRSLEKLLSSLAGKAVRGLKIPAHVTLPRLPFADVEEIERYFHLYAKSMPDGRFRIDLRGEFATVAYWRKLAPSLGIAVPDSHSPGDVFERVRLMMPEWGGVVDDLAASDEIRRFAAKPENAKKWQKLCLGVLSRLSSGDEMLVPATLSQLGSDILGDSKALRSGALRRQLALILAIISGVDHEDEERAFAMANIEDNPYTSSVTFAAPVGLVMDGGCCEEFPRNMFFQSLATQLPLATVRELVAVDWPEKHKRRIVTSENAAPFTRILKKCRACLYTGGHPSVAAKLFLRRLAEAGVECEHEGDADLDGFLIAAEIGCYIPVTKVIASEVLRAAPPDAGIELDDREKKRMEAILANPRWKNFPYRAEIENILSRGRWIEQESFARLIQGANNR